ncbi:jg8176 [Pararge aegeria aegeria]|uniref:Jg8176 protein n=1 Tax=Pararge aegeria aegeria TaxID=348720 RepID=A0A8S4SLA4_9NEOP|nr:jg8176 [Pararge aegeria aegeria]
MSFPKQSRDKSLCTTSNRIREDDTPYFKYRKKVYAEATPGGRPSSTLFIDITVGALTTPRCVLAFTEPTIKLGLRLPKNT